MSKEPQTLFKGLFGNDHFGELVDIQDQMEAQNDIWEESQTLENDYVLVENDEFDIFNIID